MTNGVGGGGLLDWLATYLGTIGSSNPPKEDLHDAVKGLAGITMAVATSLLAIGVVIKTPLMAMDLFYQRAVSKKGPQLIHEERDYTVSQGLARLMKKVRAWSGVFFKGVAGVSVVQAMWGLPLLGFGFARFGYLALLNQNSEGTTKMESDPSMKNLGLARLLGHFWHAVHDMAKGHLGLLGMGFVHSMYY